MVIVSRAHLLATALILFAGQVDAAAAPVDQVIRHSQQNFAEYLALLSLPNIPEQPSDMQHNARFLQESFTKRGFRTQLVENSANRPAVFAALDSPVAGAKTVLFYIHFDGQPVIPENWSQKSPFVPVVKERDAQGQWREVGQDRLQAQPLDPELRVFARSSSDDKGPIMMLLTAMDVLKVQRKRAAFNIKVLLDSEEEISSPNLAAMIQSNPGLFTADALVILDGPAHASGRPTMVFGNRGITDATLTVYGPPNALHSGHFGNYAPNPAVRLARLLATMKDDDGRVLIPGYYDGIELTDADRAVLQAVDDDVTTLRKRIGVAHAEKVGSTYQEALQYPSLNVRGMAAAGVGAKAANVVPSEAVAEIDIRTTPETDGVRLFNLVKQHIEKQGYHLVDRAPTAEERATYDRLASFKLGSVQAAVRIPMDAPIGRWAYAALKSSGAKTEPVRIRMMGGTVPTDVLAGALKLPLVLVPTVNADNNQHSHDENLRIGNFISGTQTIYALLTTPYR